MASITTAESPGSNDSARHIARVAAQLFAARGYDATSVRTIVEAAGVAKPTLYYHFGSKEGLAQALVTRPLTELIAEIQGMLDAPGDPVTALERVFEAHFKFSRDDPDRARFVFALFFGPLGSGLASELGRLSAELTDRLNRAVLRLAREGRIDPERVDDCCRACRGMIVIASMDFLYKNGEHGPDLARRLVNDVLQGFAAQRGPTGTRGKSC
ncbi:MAG: TetR/AcrR family transcriptional regulator [Isosphaeraceae bacterium]